MKKSLTILLVLLLAISVIGLIPACGDNDENTPASTQTPVVTQPSPTPEPTGYPVLPGKGRLRVATTTSLYDTGLWGYLEPMFEKKYGVELDVIYAGSGIALKYGETGDVDVLTVHDKAAELKFIADVDIGQFADVGDDIADLSGGHFVNGNHFGGELA